MGESARRRKCTSPRYDVSRDLAARTLPPFSSRKKPPYEVKRRAAEVVRERNPRVCRADRAPIPSRG
jgi:hypothetical protein